MPKYEDLNISEEEQKQQLLNASNPQLQTNTIFEHTPSPSPSYSQTREFLIEDGFKGVSPLCVLTLFTFILLCIYIDRGAIAAMILSIQKDLKITNFSYWGNSLKNKYWKKFNFFFWNFFSSVLELICYR